MLLVPLLSMVVSTIQWPQPRLANYTGDIILGAVFPIHERDTRYECGRLQVDSF